MRDEGESRFPRDHDYLETEEGWLLCVLGDVHPPGRVWSFLKYVPGEGPWRRGNTSYSRVMSIYSVGELLRAIEYVKRRRPCYVIYDETVSAEVLAPPLESLLKVYSARAFLEGLLEMEGRSELEDRAVEVARLLSLQSGVELSCFGITGSLLVGIAHGGSDIDLLVYGRRNFWDVIEVIRSSRGRLGIKVLWDSGPLEWLSRAQLKYPLDIRDLKALAKRVVNKCTLNGKWFSLHAVRENPYYSYGEVVFKPLGHERAVLEVSDVEDSFCTPCVYLVEPDNDLGVDRVVVYDMMLAGILLPGDEIEVYGKLELAKSRSRGSWRQILIGSYEGVGREYIRILTRA